MADNQTIIEYHLRRGPVKISYTSQFEWMQVQAASGLSPLEFEALVGNPAWVLDGWSKAHYFAWYRLRDRIEAVGHEAQMRKMDRDSS